MFWKRAVVASLMAVCACGSVHAGDLRIPLPKRDSATPVQNLNRDGVDAIKKHDVAKAKRLFYKAYLLDPDDPFTLNNLGYVSELEGQIDRAQQFYALAGGTSYNVVVDRASNSNLKGKTIAQAVGAGGVQMQVNRANLEAMRLLQQDRVVEADDVLQTALKLDPKNPFTLNNLGLVKEKEGDLRAALQSYQAAASVRSKEAAIVTTDRSDRGRPIAEVSERNASRVERRLPDQDKLENRLARLDFQGVYAVNHNDREAARQYFSQAVKLAPNDAFALNNMGFLSEMNGDQEAAQIYYQKARTADNATVKVTAATRHDAVGEKLEQLARNNNVKVDSQLETELEAKRSQHAPIQLKHRDNTPVIEPAPGSVKPEGAQ